MKSENDYFRLGVRDSENGRESAYFLIKILTGKWAAKAYSKGRKHWRKLNRGYKQW